MLEILAKKSNNNIKLLKKDMRKLGDLQADVILNLFSSCGFFDTDADNFAFFRSVNRALKIGGTFCLDITHRESYMRTLQPQEWRESNKYIVLKEQHIDLDTSRYIRNTIYINKENNQRTERFSSARIFSVFEINEWLEKAGFTICKRFENMELNARLFVPNISERLCVVAVKDHEI